MKTILPFITLAFLSVTVAAKSDEESGPWKNPTRADYPKLRTAAQTVKEFVPRNWRIVDRASGDLNRDGIRDTVLIIKGQNERFLWTGDCSTCSPLDTNPRMLIIIFKKKNGSYRIVESSRSFIIPADNPSMSEPFQKVHVKNGTLIFNFEEWYSAGTWFTADRIYRFKYLTKRFYLIGASEKSRMRNSDEEETQTYDFVQDRVRTTTHIVESTVRRRSKWRKFHIGKLKTFKTFAKPFSWRIDDFHLL